ncbi:MAG: lipopolysaccharide transport periplasmic protein LptA [Desulfuromonadales bacterium]|nr:lipopolysaccharide transport periplasmic protein LptA [Desulfuromonadales bacterium]
MKSERPIFFWLFFICLFAGSALAADPRSLDEIRVVADRMEAEAVGNKATFSGDVKASQKDIVIYAQSLTLFYSRGDDQKEQGIDRVELEGEVRILQKDRIATADKGLYLNLERKIILSGHAQVHQAGNIVKGDEIVYFIDEERSIVSSDPDSRVNVLIKPKGEDR